VEIGATAVFKTFVIRLSRVDDVGACFAAEDLEREVLDVACSTVLVSRWDCV